jgi:hypothetical protein
MITLKRVLTIGVLGAFIALFAAACSDNDAESDSNAQQSDVATINARIQRNEVLFALKAIGDLPLHDMDVAINEGQVEGSFLPNAREVVRITGLTNWPEELRNDALALQDAAILLVAALDDGDTEAAKQPATDLHELWHDFEHDALAHAAEGSDLPPEAGVESGDHGSGDATPGADETPATEGDDHSE